MFESSWSIKLSEGPEHVSIAYLPNPAVVYQGKSNQLSVYSNNENHSLPIRKQIIALDTIGHEHVLILTKYNLSCFDFMNNEEMFTKQFESAEKLFVIDRKIYVVSGTSLFCYDEHGQEQYVNHVSANITTITNVATENITNNQDIVIATTDMTMLRYSKLNIVFDYGKIIGAATSLCWVGKGVMVGTEEGPIAFYQSKKYKWKAKSIHAVSKILKFQEASEFNKNSEFIIKKADKIVVIRVDGNIELRDWENGGTLSKIKTGENVINSFVLDFRKQGTNQIVCALQSGNVKAYNLKDQAGENNQQSIKTSTVAETLQKGDEVEKLNKMKQQLLFSISELKNALAEKGDGENDTGGNGEILSPDFKLAANLDYNDGLILHVNVTNGYIAGLTFQQPLMPVFVDKAQSLKYKFLDSTQSAGDLNCEVLVHSSISATKFEIKKIPISLPKFWKWGLDPSARDELMGKLKFKLIERNSRYILWMKQCFFMNISSKEEQRMQTMSQMKFKFVNSYDNKHMEMIFSQKTGTVVIHCDCLKTMGQIFQDLINYVGLKNLNSQLDFSSQKQKVKQALETVERLSQTKVSITTDLADSINSIKFLLVKGQSARIVGAMGSFRKTYGEIMEHNRNLITEIEKKNQNTKILTQTLKSVNIFINQIANVRYGEPKNKVIAKCREAIKSKRFPEIYSIMDKGAEIDQ